MIVTDLIILINDLVKQPHENEWLEFKLNFHSVEEIGERISALANGACIHKKTLGYLVFGIEDQTHKIVGTTFNPKIAKKGNEDIEHWLLNRINPRIDFNIHFFEYDKGRNIVVFEIPAAKNQPIAFIHKSYIRVGSITKQLHEYPDKEAKIWRNDAISFEKEIAKNHLTASDIINYLSTETYFDLLKMPYPTNQDSVIHKFLEEGFIVKNNFNYAITKLGGLLFAKKLKDFESLERKTPRVIIYKGKNKVETEREQIGGKGYALGFVGLLDWIYSQLPANEEIGKALRENTTMYPQIAIREIVANALIHQDLNEKGFPMIEVFTDRIEISNPGTPLINPDRFIDTYYSRNEKLADIMRRMGFCEEKGSGLDKVIFNNELYQLPPINIIIDEKRTRITLYSYKTLNQLGKKEKIAACYQHACLKYVSNEKMTNETLRGRFKIESHNASTASRIIRDAIEAGFIKDEDPENKSRKYAKYLPFWA